MTDTSSTSSVEAFQISETAAEFYETRFVPRLFGPWARHLVDAAGVAPGRRVLDVACGTGIVARTAADRLGDDVRVTGVDLNPNMLAVARRLRPKIDWRQGDAGALPFDADSFDVVLCQSALMFFPDPAQALREMARVATPASTVAVQVWATLDAQPAYGPFVDVATRHAGPEALSLLGTYWSMGDLERLRGLLEAAGLEVAEIRTLTENARFDSIDELVATEVESTPLAERISEQVYARILADSREALRAFVTGGGAADIPLVGHIVTARHR